jgi:hypothetical protein
VAEEFVPFDEALKTLRVSADELKRMVSEDEIQAVRDASGKIRLRKQDVEKLKQRASGVEELEFAGDEDEGEESGMVTAVLEDDSLLEEEETLDTTGEELKVEAAKPAARGVKAPVRTKSRTAALRGAEPEGQEKTVDRVMLIFSTVLLAYALFFAQSIAVGQKTGLTAVLSDMFK